MAVCSPGNMSSAGVSEVNMLSLIYLFNGSSHWEAAMDGEFGSRYERRHFAKRQTINIVLWVIGRQVSGIIMV